MTIQHDIPMLRKVLVPLDGSELAEEVLPLAAQIARAPGASVILLQVILPSSYITTSPLEPLRLEEKAREDAIARANAYLQRIRASEQFRHMRVETVVELGGAPHSIIAYAQAHQVDLIVMRSHGETGFKRWLLGSVARQVLRHSFIPVLVIRERSTAPGTLMEPFMHAPRILVPLDGSELAEAALLPAAQLCAALAYPKRGAIHITQVVQRLAPVVRGPAKSRTRQTDREVKAGAQAYGRQIMQRFQAGDLAGFKLDITSSVVAYEDAEEIVSRIIEECNCIGDVPGFSGCDVISMATHGRHGFQHMLWGSFTEEVFDATKQPLLIVHAPEVSSRQSEGSEDLARHQATVSS